ncbi:NDxxF motif lipoprotein [Staphylococcus hominis]|uniref:NDxxF motif lipoprotein n=1 Tax=Staphylococcus hominis TaxID=1290 RepID=UPI001F566323|nr:NDxxF motif lipoprotein [Staphylococcus hominis]MCI2890158.1 NDxxF motif lipoprotein [Staphylococcus hominis]MDS3867003.1 NDxxF motif lipoprotein [Staphylococcus hominis]
MKKIVIVTLILILSIGLVGCHRLSKEDSDPSDNAKTQEEHSTEENKSSDDQDISLEPDTKIPDHVFEKTSVRHVQISEKTIKKDIKTYSNIDKKINDTMNTYKMKLYSNQKLSNTEANKLKKLIQLENENDTNFAQYIQNNQMPNNDYVIYTDKISRYISTANRIEQKSLEISLKSDDDTSIFNDIEQVNKNQDIVNDQEKQDIANFLEDKNIKTETFNEDSNHIDIE